MIDVQCYDDDQRNLLSRLTAWPRIHQLIQDGLRIPKEQFLVYSLFRHRDTQGLAELRDLASSRERLLRTTLSGNHDSFSAHPDLEATEHRTEAQEIGEALGLCLMDAIFGTHEADWLRIPEGPANKTLDYAASDGHAKLEVESKGSFVEDRTRKPPAVSRHKTDIARKKAATTGTGVRVGTIASIDRQEGGRPMLWLVDPPPAHSERSPEDVQTLHRFDFITRMVSLISPRSPLAAALATRLADLQNIRDIRQLEGVPLMAGSGTELGFSTRFGTIHNSFFSVKSVVADGPAGGVLVRSSNDEMFFWGIRQDWIDIAVEQSFQRMREYRTVPATVSKTLTALLPAGRFTRYDFDEDWREVEKTGGYYRFPLEGDLHYSAGGIVFGWLPIPRPLRAE